MTVRSMTTRNRGARRRLVAAMLASACALVGVHTSASAQALYSISELPALPGGGCTPSAIDGTGNVVGSCGPSFGETAVVWRNGVIAGLGKLPSGHYSEAHAINANGLIVGEADTGNLLPQATLYRNGAWLNINPDGGSNIRAIGVSDTGVIVGDYAKGLSGNTAAWRGVIWTERATQPGRFDMVTLPIVPGGTSKSLSNYATASNNAVQVVGWVTSSVFGQLGAFWNNDAAHSVVTLSPLPGDWSSIAWGVNDLGETVGESHPPFHSRAVLWAADAAHTPIDLGLLPGDVDSTATAVNNVSQVIGTSTAADGTMHPFLWQNGQISEINSLLDASGAGWVVQQATALNALGRIVGVGLHNGQPAAFVMTPLGQ
jgi:probable HAF family extracellular repeat protein